VSIQANHTRRSTAEASAPGWLGLFFGETDDRRRLTVAFAFAIAIVAIGAQVFIALLDRTPPPEETIAKAMVVTITKKPKPTPRPTPKPTPTPVVHPRVIAQVVDPGKSAAKEIVKKPAANRPKVVSKYHIKPVAAVPVGGQGAGAGRKGTVGSLGNGGNGSGAGDQGNGSGGVCGAVDFVDPRAPSFDASTGLSFYDGIEMVVHYADGHAETVTLDYPWHYRDQTMDPFKNASAPMLFQFPPKSMRPSEPPLVQYVMAHTNVMGVTDLNECANIPALATPHA